MPDALLIELEEVLVDTRAKRRKALADALRAERIHVALEPDVLWHADPHSVVAQLLRRRSLVDDTLVDLVVARAERAFSAAVGAGISMQRGASEFLRRAQGKTRLACITALRRQDASRVLELAGFESAFDVLISAEDVLTARPDPDAYVKVLARLGRKRALERSRCIALESTVAGIGAACTAGVRVVAVGVIGAPLALEHGANGYASSLAGATIDSLRALAGVTGSREPSP